MRNEGAWKERRRVGVRSGTVKSGVCVTSVGAWGWAVGSVEAGCGGRGEFFGEDGA